MPRNTRPTARRSPAIDSTPDPQLIARFRADLAPLLPGGARLAIAVSGGPDSLALLLLGHGALGRTIAAASVDHGLRPESGEEARFVAQLCARLGVPHTILPVAVAPGNLQQEARRARYEAMGQWMEATGLTHLATAHHADDQAETLLMRLNRASGVAGLAGVRAKGLLPGTRLLQVVRPLLGWRKAELEGIVRDAGLQPVRDPSNANADFDRVRMRHALASAEWLDAGRVAVSAGHLADADDALEWMAQRELDGQVRVGPDTAVYRPLAPRAVRLRVLMRAIETMGGVAVRGQAAADLLDALEAGRGGNVGGVLARVDPTGDWVLRREPLRSAGRRAPPD